MLTELKNKLEQLKADYIQSLNNNAAEYLADTTDAIKLFDADYTYENVHKPHIKSLKCYIDAIQNVEEALCRIEDIEKSLFSLVEDYDCYIKAANFLEEEKSNK